MKNNCCLIGTFQNEDEKKHFVELCDRDFERRIKAVCLEIAGKENLHFLGLTGPTCSGKTTTARLLTEVLAEKGHRVHVISLDDYYYDKEILLARTPEGGEIDYDSEETIDLSLLEEKVLSLLDEKPTVLPRFDFHSGHRVDRPALTPEEGDVFLFEGIQLLYPGVQRILSGVPYLSIYIKPHTSICVGGETFDPEELRLLRRLVRDVRHRSAPPEFTLQLWPGVRRNEDVSIFPYVGACNYVIDSTMPYEVGMLKPYLEATLPTVPKDHPSKGKAEAILVSLSHVEPISSDYMLPNSLYKEFI